MEPFKNNNTNKNTEFFGYTNPNPVSKQEYSYTTNNDINLESYFNQPYTENNSNSYDINYLPITNETNNNYSYTFPETINSEKGSINYSNYIEPSHSKEYISNTNYNNNSGNIKSTKNTTKSNFSNFATVKPLQVSIKDKNENINYNYYSNNNELLNPSKNVKYYTGDTTTYYTGDTTNFYTGLNNTNNNLESNLISSTTNNLNNINLNENHTNNVTTNNPSSTNNNFSYVPASKNTYNIPYDNYISNNKISNKNITINNNNNVNTHVIKNKKNMNNVNNKNLEGLNKVNSNYILLKILNLVKDYNKYRLFMYCKKFQTKLGLKSLDYKIRSIERTGIKVCNYLSGYFDKKVEPHPYYILRDEYKDQYEYCFKKDSLKNLFDYHLKRLKIKYIKDYLIYYFKKYKEDKKDDSNLYIDIFCPFFNLLSTQEYFSDLFTIPIDMQFIKYNNIKNVYISAFNRLNKLKNNYSILFNLYNAEDFNFFNSFINLNKVNKLKIYLKQTDDEKHPLNEEIGFSENGLPFIKSVKSKCDPEKLFKVKFNRLFNEILTGKNNLIYNLQYLNIHADLSHIFNPFNRDELNLIENLNNFKSLIHLELENFYFKDISFELKLNSIKVFKIKYCSGILISENVCTNLKELFIYKSNISYINSPLKFPNLEKFETYYYLEDDNFKDSYNFMDTYNGSIDFTSLCNLKIMKVEAEDFLKLKNNTLESLTLVSNFIDPIKEKKIMEKIISMKSLKEVIISLKTINNDNINEIQGKNPSVEKLEIYWDKKKKSDTNIINLQKKFPNVKNLSLSIYPDINKLYDTNLKIEENKNCKINSLSVYGYANIKLYISSFENLVEFDLIMHLDKGIRIKECLPFMHKNCNIIFKSMTSFKFKVFDLEYELLDNIIDNLDKMPNLKTLELRCDSPVENTIYNKLNKKISSMGLININIMLYFETSLGPKDKIINVLDAKGITIRK